MIALPSFVIPFTFCYNPALLLQGNAFAVSVAIVTALLGVGLMSICLTGYIDKPVPMIYRIVFLIGGILLLVPYYLESAVGFILAAAAFVVFSISSKKRVRANMPQENR